MAEPELVAVDYVVIAAMLSVSIIVGIIVAIRTRKTATKEDYLLGSRKLHFLPVALSLFVTFMSSSSLIGAPAETYTTGSEFFMLSIGIGLSYLVSIFTVVPVMHTLKVTSMYEYFHMRFQSYFLRILVTVVGMVQKIIFISVVLLSPALSIQTVASLPFWMSVVIVGMVGIIYTSIGGIRGVVLVDVFQAAIILIGVYAVMIKGMSEVGGLSKTWELAKEGGRILPVDFNPDPRIRHSFWSLGIGGTFSFLAYSFDQSAIQRVCSIATVRGAKIAYAINIFLTNFYIVSVCLLGIVAYAYFTTLDCDPIKSGAIINRNQLMPYVVMRLFKDYPGMTGLYLATIFCGALSTISSVINALAANTIEDLLRVPFKKWNVSDKGRLLVAKLAVCFYGGLCMGLAFVAKEFPGTVIQTAIALLGAFGGPIIGLFFLGALVPWTNKIGAFAGVIVSLILNMVLSIGAVFYGGKPVMLPPAPSNSCFIETSNFTTSVATTTLLHLGSTIAPTATPETDPGLTVFDISYQHYGLTGWLIVLLIGLPVSFLTRKMYPRITDELLLFPFVRPLWKVKKHNEKEANVNGTVNEFETHNTRL